MGKIKQGILGGFKGKVGTVIGSSWNGISYMRSDSHPIFRDTRVQSLLLWMQRLAFVSSFNNLIGTLKEVSFFLLYAVIAI